MSSEIDAREAVSEVLWICGCALLPWLLSRFVSLFVILLVLAPWCWVVGCYYRGWRFFGELLLASGRDDRSVPETCYERGASVFFL